MRVPVVNSIGHIRTPLRLAELHKFANDTVDYTDFKLGPEKVPGSFSRRMRYLSSGTFRQPFQLWAKEVTGRIVWGVHPQCRLCN